MGMTPFEIRLELLKMAKESLLDPYFGEKERRNEEWNRHLDIINRLGNHVDRENLPTAPELPPYPSSKDIIAKAKELNDFVSNS